MCTFFGLVDSCPETRNPPLTSGEEDETISLVIIVMLGMSLFAGQAIAKRVCKHSIGVSFVTGKGKILKRFYHVAYERVGGFFRRPKKLCYDASLYAPFRHRRALAVKVGKSNVYCALYTSLKVTTTTSIRKSRKYGKWRYWQLRHSAMNAIPYTALYRCTVYRYCSPKKKCKPNKIRIHLRGTQNEFTERYCKCKPYTKFHYVGVNHGMK